MSTLSLLYEFFLMKGFCLIWAWMIASAASVGVAASFAVVLTSFEILNFFHFLLEIPIKPKNTIRAAECACINSYSVFKVLHQIH